MARCRWSASRFGECQHLKGGCEWIARSRCRNIFSLQVLLEARRTFLALVHFALVRYEISVQALRQPDPHRAVLKQGSRQIPSSLWSMQYCTWQSSSKAIFNSCNYLYQRFLTCAVLSPPQQSATNSEWGVKQPPHLESHQTWEGLKSS